MMKRKIIKNICIAGISALVVSLFPNGVMAAEDVSDKKIINLEYDTYIDKNKNTTQFSSSTIMKFQRNGNYHREPLLGFNLDDVSPDDGMEIVSAKITVYLESYYYKIDNVNTKNSSVISMYAMGNVDYLGDGENKPEITWKNNYNSKKEKIAATTFCADNTFKEGTAYEFDITEYIKGKAAVSGREVFALFPNTQYVSGAIYASEANNGIYTPTMTVTYKYSDKTFTAIDTAHATEDATSDNLLTTYAIQKTGSSKYNRAAYSKFDLSTLAVPKGAAISEAVLRLYVTHNYNKTSTAVRIYNIQDDSWSDLTVVGDTEVSSWENAPDSEHMLSGLGAAQGISSAVTVPYEDSTVVNQWIEFDVTSYVAGQYNSDASKIVSFAAYPETARAATDGGAVNIASDNYEGYEPQLVISFANDTEVKVGTPVFSLGVLADTADTLVNGKQTFVKIPVSGASNTPKKTDIYIVQFDAKTDELVGINIFNDIDLYAGNGELAFGYYSEKVNKECYTEVYVWSPEGLSYADAHIDMTTP